MIDAALTWLAGWAVLLAPALIGIAVLLIADTTTKGDT